MAEFVWQNETLKRWGLQEYALEHSTATKFYRNDPKFSDTQNICCNHSKSSNYVALP